ncbi:MAG: pyrroline-5-carboxylate reductase [Candidatus Methanoplasma sp.]|nr:pyrroline-5-carboxylate reductase [Candidatus Methanoplasma sp.]
MKAKIGFIGAGRMAEAMIGGLISEDVYSEKEIIGCAPSEATRARVASKLGIAMYGTAAEVSRSADVIVIAVKPKHISGLFGEDGFRLGPEHLVISIAAGIRIKTLESYVPDARIVRVMPNHCCMVLEGASGYSRGTRATDGDMELVDGILSSVGLAVEVAEEDLDAVTGMSGSSPAFMYMFADAIADVGKRNGLPADVAMDLVAQSFVGAGKMMLETGMTPEELIDSVCSPGGTTIEGVRVLDGKDMRSMVREAVEAVIDKSRKMGG